MFALATLLVALLVPVVAWAHPLGNFTINHYSRLEFAPKQVRILYVLDMAEIPTLQTTQQVDSNGDGRVDDTEGATFAAAKMVELQQNMQLTFNTKPIVLTSRYPDLSFPPGQGGLSLLRLTFWLEGELPAITGEAQSIEYRDANNAGHLGWREIVVRAQDGLHVLDSTVSDKDQSDELRVYPQDMLSSPLNETEARFSLQVDGNSSSATTPDAPRQLGSAKSDGAFAALITLPQLDPSVVVLALLTALGLGALHALEPGHGKTAAASYLVGARATPRHAVVLGLTMTAMHTSSVFILGSITLFAARWITPERVLPWLGLASGLIVIALGLQMFFSRLRQRRSSLDHASQGVDLHNHSPHNHDHSAHSHDHAHPHISPTMPGSTFGWRGVLAVGISGGLLPCPAALIVLLSAIGLGRVGFGLLLIVAFSAGLALVLSIVGLVVLYGSRWLGRQSGSRLARIVPGFAQLAETLPAYTGLLVVGAGFLLLYHAWPLLRVWQP